MPDKAHKGKAWVVFHLRIDFMLFNIAILLLLWILLMCLNSDVTLVSARSYDVKDEDVEAAFSGSYYTISERRKLEIKLKDEGRIVTPKHRHADPSLIRSRRYDPKIYIMESIALPFQIATDHLYTKYNFSNSYVNSDLPSRNIDGDIGRAAMTSCEDFMANPTCDPLSPYRTQDGTCNNLQNPRWGSALSCFQRLQNAFYTGGSGFRQSVYGGPLPEPRTLSLNIHNNLNRPTNDVTHMYMFFGQLLDHDITLTAPSVLEGNDSIQCCPQQEENHPQCAPINISSDDPFYSQFGVTCLNFVRNAPCSICALGPRMHSNVVTGFIDGSFIYGNNESETFALRRNDDSGKLRMQETAAGSLLPQSFNPSTDSCSIPSENQICFEAGDSRVNQHKLLTSLQTLFAREHNRIADELHVINPGWDEETLFQEARKIVSAIMQVITYKEYLPITLGKDRMSYFNLWIQDKSSTIYDPSINPSLYTEFPTAAFRFGHSMINSVIANYPLSNSNQRRLLRDDFFKPFELYNGIMDPLLHGASESPAQQFDRHVVPDVTNYLYRIGNDSTGLDLASINIQRGRDHGIPPYTKMVYYCSDRKIEIRVFKDLVRYNLMTEENVNRLRQNYRHVDDIDLWTGILNEINNKGAVVGPTGACIVGIQYYNLKFGDRFYFEHKNQRGSFTNSQIIELRKMTLSKVICMNTVVKDMQQNAMLFPSNGNPVASCNRLTGPNLTYWKQ